jgi:hypothetical protein
VSAQRPRSVFLAIAFALVFHAPALAGPAYLRGSWSADLLRYDNGTQSQWEPYSAMRLNFTKPLGLSNRYWGLRLDSRVRVFRDGDVTTVSMKNYDGYLILGNVIRKTTLTLGQQFVYNTLRSSHLFGARVQYTPTRRMRAEIFGGDERWYYDITKSYDPTYHVFGARLSGDLTATTRLGVNWMYRRTGGREVYHRAGIDLTQQIGKSEWYGRGAWNLINNRVVDLLGRLTVTPKDWYASGELNWREPNVDANSIFSVIAYDKYTRARFELRRRLTKQLWMYNTTHATFVSGGAIWQGTLGVSGSGFSVGWSHQKGRGTKSDGLTGYVAADINKNWTVFGNSNLSRYRVQGEQVDLSDAYAASVGIGWRPGSGWQVQMQGQWLRNAVRTSDVRFLLQLSKSFSATIGGKGAGK